MKKTSFLTIGLIVISIGFLNAQTNKGKLLLGLSSDIFNLGYSSSMLKSDATDSEQENKSFNVNFQSKIGYFFIDNFVIGLDLSTGLQTGKTGDDNDKYTFTSSHVGPFVRYYIPTSKVLPFFELGGSIGSMNTKFEDGKDKTGIIKYGGGIGLAVPIGERVMADVLAGYHSTTFKDMEDNENNERRIIGTLGVNVGFTILLGSN